MNKTKNIFIRTGEAIKDFFNFKDWVKVLRTIPGLALTLMTVAVVLMNILANKSIIEYPSGNAWIIQDAGILLSWVGFLVGDLLVRNFGAKNAIRVSLTCLATSLFISGLLAIVGVIPGTWSPEFGLPADQAAVVGSSINTMMSGVWQIILGSAFASAVGLIVNGIMQGQLLKRIQRKHGEKYWGFFTASAVSTMLGQFLDNFVFALLVSVSLFGWGWQQVIMCSLIGAVLELVIELIFTPLTYKISQNWKKNKIGSAYISLTENKADDAFTTWSVTEVTSINHSYELTPEEIFKDYPEELSADEVCKMIGICRTTLQRIMKADASNRLVSTKQSNGRIIIKKVDVIAYISRARNK